MNYARRNLEHFGQGKTKSVEEVGKNKFKVVWEEREAAEKVSAMNGKKFTGGNGRLKVQSLEAKLTVQQVFDLITEKLDTSQRKSWKMPNREERETRRTEVVSF